MGVEDVRVAIEDAHLETGESDGIPAGLGGVEHDGDLGCLRNTVPPRVRVKVCDAPVFTSPTVVVPPLARTPVSDFTSAPPERLTLPDSKLPLPELCIVRIVETVPRPLPDTPPRLESKIRSAEATYGVERAAIIPRTSAKVRSSIQLSTLRLGAPLSLP